MPEGHTLHRLAIHFTKTFGGQRVRAASPQGRFAEGAQRIDGRVLGEAEAHGKHLFLGFDSGEWVRVHLGLYGAWTFGDATGERSLGAPRTEAGTERALQRDADGFVVPPPPTGAVRLRLVSADAWADLRGPSACEVIDPAGKQAVQARLGPDPLRADADREEAVRRLAAYPGPVGAAVLDQGVWAGVGNAWRAELLFLAGLNPETRGVGAETAGRLWDDAARYLALGRDAGQVVSDPSAPDERWVYKRETCRRCGTPVRTWTLASRTAYACPVDQGR